MGNENASRAWVLICGNPVDGLKFVGPFMSHKSARVCGAEYAGDWWIAPIDQPVRRKYTLTP